MKFLIISIALASIYAAEGSDSCTTSLPLGEPRCFRPERNTVYQPSVILGQNYEIKFKYYPKGDSDADWNELFRITADPNFPDAGVANARNIALFTRFNNPNVLHLIVGNSGNWNQNCDATAVASKTQDITITVIDSAVEFSINGNPVCSFTLAAPNQQVTGALMTSDHYPAVNAQICDFKLTNLAWNPYA